MVELLKSDCQKTKLPIIAAINFCADQSWVEKCKKLELFSREKSRLKLKITQKSMVSQN